MIRPITADELPRVHEMGAAFFDAAGRPGKYSPEAVERIWNTLLPTGIGLFFVAEDEGRFVGMFGGVVSEDPYTGDIVALEQFWFVMPEARGSVGIRLFNAFEKEATARGAKRILMVHLMKLTPESLRGLYERRGYELVEQIYEKNLCPLQQ